MKGIGGEPPTTPPTPHPIPGEMGENGKLIDLLLLSEHSTVVFREGGERDERPSVAKYCYGIHFQSISHKTLYIPPVG